MHDELEEPDNRWQLTQKRRDKIEHEADRIKRLVNAEVPPSFDEMNSAIEKLVFEFETVRNA